MKYSVEIKKSVFKVLKSLSKENQIYIAAAIKKLSLDPRPRNCLKLSGSSYYRIRCGNYRIIYDIQDDRLVIIVLKIGHRKNIFKRK